MCRWMAWLGQPVLIEPNRRNLVGAIVKMSEIPGTYLYTIRLVDPDVIRARQIVTDNSNEYRGLEGNRRTTQIAFALLYLGLTLIFPLFGIFRYLYLVHQKEGGGSQSEMLLNDRPLLLCVALWAIAVAGIIYGTSLIHG